MVRPSIAAFILALALWHPRGSPAIPQTEDPALKAQRAREALTSGNYAKAIAIYEDLVKALPNVPGLRMNLGMAQFMAGRSKEAIPHLAAAAKGDPQLTSAWLFLGAAYMKLGQPGDAIAPLKQYTQREPRQAQGHQMLADALRGLGRFEEAVGQLRTLSELGGDNPQVWYGLGRSYEALAGKAFDLLEKSSAESGFWFALIADSRVAQQLYDSAFYFYRKALEKQPKMRGIHAALSEIYRLKGHSEWALEEKQKEIALGEPDCTIEKVLCDYLSERYEQVIAAVKDKNTPETYFWRCRAYNQLAVAAFAKLASLPPSFELHQLRAEIHRNQKRYAEAVKEWEEAIKIAPDNPVARRELAVSLLLGRDFERAGRLVDELLKDDPDSAELNWLAGDSLLNRQKVEEAIPFLEKAVRKDAGLLAAHVSLGRAYVTAGQHAKAIPHLEIGVQSDEDGSLHYQLSRAYQNTGQRDLARQALRKYQEITARLEEEKSRLEQEVRITAP